MGEPAIIKIKASGEAQKYTKLIKFSSYIRQCLVHIFDFVVNKFLSFTIINFKNNHWRQNDLRKIANKQMFFKLKPCSVYPYSQVAKIIESWVLIRYLNISGLSGLICQSVAVLLTLLVLELKLLQAITRILKHANYIYPTTQIVFVTL